MHTHHVICSNLDNYKLYSLHKQVFVLKIQLASERIPSNAISSEQVHVMQKGNLLVETRMLKKKASLLKQSCCKNVYVNSSFSHLEIFTKTSRKVTIKQTRDYTYMYAVMH